MLRRLRNWLTDSLRLGGAVLYWNLRKSRFVLAGRRGRCPCQDQSDDSVPGRVRCEAVLHWHNPGRFRRVCPLLIQTQEGWRCSVASTQVRPFWGLAARQVGLALLAAYLLGVVAVHEGLRLVTGLKISWRQVAWPAAWAEIPHAQAQQLFNQAILAFEKGELPAAQLALTAARLKDPNHYDATLLLAQIEMFQLNLAVSDQMFAELRKRHPEQAIRTAIVYHDTLLGMDRQRVLAAFSLAMVKVDPGHAVVWVRSALLAVRSMQASEAAELAAKLPAFEPVLAEHARRLLGAELELKTQGRKPALELLRTPFPGPYNPFYVEYQIERLAELGAPADAQWILDQQGPVLGEFGQLRAQVALAMLAGDAWGARAAFAALLKLPLTAAQVDRVAGLLIAHPDQAFFGLLQDRVRQDPKLLAAVEPATMWITGLACGSVPEARWWSERNQQAGLSGFPNIATIDFSSRDLGRDNTACHLINVVSFPREVILALLWQTEPRTEGKPRGGR